MDNIIATVERLQIDAPGALEYAKANHSGPALDARRMALDLLANRDFFAFSGNQGRFYHDDALMARDGRKVATLVGQRVVRVEDGLFPFRGL